MGCYIMAEMVLEEFEKKLKLLKVVLFSCGHGDHFARLFGGHKRFYDGQ